MSDVPETPSDDEKDAKPARRTSADTAASTAETEPVDTRWSPALIATLITVPVLVIAGFIAFAALKYSGNDDPQTPVDGYATGGPGAGQCTDFIAKLPAQLGDFNDKTIDDTTVRWRKEGSAPLVLKCGVQRPEALEPTSALQVINPIQWFLTDSLDDAGQAYVSVDHRPYIAVWVPLRAGNAPITDLSALIAENLTPAPLDFGD